MTVCVINGCHSSTNKSKKHSNITFHLFPSDPIIADRWTQKIRLNRNDICWKPNKRTRVCSLHFNDDDKYITKGGLCRLHHGVIPSENIPIFIIEKEATSHLLELSQRQPGTSSGAVASSSVTQNVFPEVTSDADSLCDDDEADEATTSPPHDTTDKDPLQTLDIKAKVDPDDEQPMAQDNDSAVDKYVYFETDIKKEVDDTCEFETSVTVLSHVSKSSAETEELKRQLEAKTSEVEMYKNEVNDLQQKNIVLQDQSEKLTKLLIKCLTKSPCKEIGTQFKKILSHPQHNVENYRKKVQEKECQYKAKIKMLLESIEESQQLLKAKQKQWETKENDLIEKIKQLERNLQQLQQSQVDDQAVQFLEKDNILEEKEREWLEKERQWLERLEVKETQWLEKERLWQEQMEERDRQISRLQGTCLESNR